MAANGGLIVEVSGQEDKHKADRLAEGLRTVLRSDAVVTRSVIFGEIIVSGFDLSVGLDDLTCIVAEKGVP